VTETVRDVVPGRAAFERVIVSHGEPVHDRVELGRALERRPWTG
jgi:hypothetical protein